MFKYKMGGIPDCTQEGMSLYRAFSRLNAEIDRKYYPPGWNMEDEDENDTDGSDEDGAETTA